MGGPLAIYADGFRQELTARGYVHQVVERNLRVLVHLSDWMQAGSVSVGQLSPARLETFIGDRRQQGYRGWLSVPAVTPLLGYLRSVGVVLATPEAPAARGPVEQLVEQYQRYLVDERGLSAAVMRKYSEFAHAFLSATEGPDGLELADLSAATVTDYVVSEYAARPSRSAKSTVTALRSLLRYLFLAGLIEHQLALAVPTAAHWQAGSLPRALGSEAVAALTASCDDSTEIGCRDRAILVLLCRLGLRACEITRLELDDLDWRSGEVSGERQGRSPGPTATSGGCGRGPGRLPSAGPPSCQMPHGVLAGQRPDRGPDRPGSDDAGVQSMLPGGAASSGSASAAPQRCDRHAGRRRELG